MSRKSKGINAERDLIHKFWAAEWGAVRVAGSGSSVYPSPDIIASNKTRRLAVECKSCKGKYQYLTKDGITQLKTFSAIFDAEPWVAVKFNKVGWFFIKACDLKETNKNFNITPELAAKHGKTFEQLTKNF